MALQLPACAYKNRLEFYLLFWRGRNTLRLYEKPWPVGAQGLAPSRSEDKSNSFQPQDVLHDYSSEGFRLSIRCTKLEADPEGLD
jgi:hypothetical protein